MTTPPDDLIAMSARLGADPLLIQGAGGNTSAKIGPTLWVKASGKWLAAAAGEPVFAAVDLADVRTRIDAGDPDPVRPGPEAPNLRPSIETTLHALMPQRVVAHVHSVNALAWAVRADARERLAERLAGLRWAFVPYVRPGLPLTHAVAGALAGGGNADVLLMGNHGLLVGADDCVQVEALLAEVEQRLQIVPRPAPPFDRARLEARAAAAGLRLPRHDIVHAVATDPVNLRIASGGSLYPDHVVFLGPGAVVVEPDEDPRAVIARREQRGWPRPRLLLARGAGALVDPTLGDGAEEMARCLALVASRIAADARICYLTPEQDAELLDWDAEKFRQAAS